MSNELDKWIIIGSGGDKYNLTTELNGDVSCTCLGFINYEKCYHSKYVKDCIEKGVRPKETIKRSIKIFS